MTSLETDTLFIIKIDRSCWLLAFLIMRNTRKLWQHVSAWCWQCWREWTRRRRSQESRRQELSANLDTSKRFLPNGYWSQLLHGDSLQGPLLRPWGSAHLDTRFAASGRLNVPHGPRADRRDVVAPAIRKTCHWHLPGMVLHPPLHVIDIEWHHWWPSTTW